MQVVYFVTVKVPKKCVGGASRSRLQAEIRIQAKQVILDLNLELDLEDRPTHFGGQ